MRLISLKKCDQGVSTVNCHKVGELEGFHSWRCSELTHWDHDVFLRHTFQFSSVQSLSRVWFFVTPWIAARQASLSITNSWSSLRLTSIKSVMPSSHLILCRPRLLLPPIPPSIRVFSNESTLRMRWPKYWSFSFGYWRYTFGCPLFQTLFLKDASPQEFFTNERQ